MPYIKNRSPSAEFFPADSGALNYAITVVVSQYLDRKGLSYKTCNDIVGALESAKLEFYRRIVSPYEDQKCFENGDVYDTVGLLSEPL